MVLWYQAAVAPGNLSASVAGACSTVITLTTGAAEEVSRVPLATSRPSYNFKKKTTRKLTIKTTATPMPKRRILCPVAADRSFWGGIVTGSYACTEFSFGECVGNRSGLVRQKAEHDGHEHQGREGGENKTADHRTSQRRVLFASLTHGERHGDHAQYHRTARHENRTQSGVARLLGRRPDIVPGFQPLIGEGHDQDAVGCGQAYAHQSAHERRNAQVRLRQIQHPHDPAQGKRNSQQHDERIDPTLKIDHHEHVHEHHRERHAGKYPRIAGAHGFHLSAQDDRDGFRRIWPVLCNHFVDVRRDRIQIAAYDVRIDVKHRTDVVLRQYQRYGTPAEAGDVHQYLLFRLPVRRHQRHRI